MPYLSLLLCLAGADWPAVKDVEAQPLIAQVKRLGQALEFLGQPLPKATLDALADLKPKDEAAPAAIQKLLDPLCVAAVEIGPKGVTGVIAPAGKPALLEQ